MSTTTPASGSLRVSLPAAVLPLVFVLLAVLVALGVAGQPNPPHRPIVNLDTPIGAVQVQPVHGYGTGLPLSGDLGTAAAMDTLPTPVDSDGHAYTAPTGA